MLRIEDKKFKQALQLLEKWNKADRVNFFKKKDPSRFLLWWFYYYRNEFVTKLADFHYEWIEALFTWNNVFIEGFRWSIKTTIIIAYETYEISNWFCKFVNWQSFDDSASTRNTTNIALKLLNPLLVNDYWKILALTWWNKEDLQKKSVWNFDTTNWIKVMATSLWQKLRWAVSKNARPDRLIIDDIDVNDSVRNPELIDKNYTKLTWETFWALTKEGKSQIIFLWNTIWADWIVPRFRKEKASSKWWILFHQPLMKWWEVVWDFFKPETIEKIKADEWELAFNQNYLLIPLISNWNPVFQQEKFTNIKELQYKTDTRYKELRIYKKPETNIFWGVDTALWGEWWDYSVISIRNQNLELIATYKAKIAPDLLDDVINYIVWLWYRGLIWIENNNTWIATITKAKERPRASLLYREKQIDKITARPVKKFWFNTNAKSKHLIINNLEEYIRKDLITEFDERSINDYINYYYDEKGSTNALKGSHDDFVIADAICLFMTSQNQNMWV